MKFIMRREVTFRSFKRFLEICKAITRRQIDYEFYNKHKKNPKEDRLLNEVKKIDIYYNDRKG